MITVKKEIANDAEAQSDLGVTLKTNFVEMQAIATGLVALCEKKDKEYGASWCRRGGRGAYYTFVRKPDRIDAQLKKRGDNIFDVRDDADLTEGIDETLRDMVAYGLLILERRAALRAKIQETLKAEEALDRDGSGPDASYVKQ